MVDKRQQIEDDEYSQEDMDDQYDYEESDEESDDESDEESDDEYEDYSDDDFRAKSSSAIGIVKVIGILFIVIFVAVIAFSFMNSKKNAPANNNYNNQVETAQQQNIPYSEQTAENNNSDLSTEQVAENFFKEAGGDSQDMMSVNFNNNGETNVETSNGETNAVATVQDVNPQEGQQNDLFGEQNQAPGQNQEQSQASGQNQQQIPVPNNNQILVSYNSSSRLNPFKPFEKIIEQKNEQEEEVTENLANIPFEIIEPPTSSVPDENISALLATQISGILYDEDSPSAIVNINGQDQFVKVGDTVSGYKIKKITRNKVEISYENNDYVASVGELFTKGKLDNQSSIDNLEHKFAGRYKKK